MVKFSVSPAIAPTTVTVALDNSPLVLESARPGSSATAEPPPSNGTVPPAVTVGGVSTVTVEVPVVLLSTPSFTIQSIVRLPVVAPVELSDTDSSTV